jgi:hypothetical protein
MFEDNIAKLRSFYETAPQGQNKAAKLLDSQIEWIEPESAGGSVGGVHHGPQAVFDDVILPTLEKFDDFQLELDEFLTAGNRIIVTGRFRGRNKESGVELNAPFAHIWTLRDGKAVRFCNYTDTANWMHALNLLPVEHHVGA